MSLAAEEVFAGYTVVRLLGAGAMGEVYLAKHPHLLRQDAIRVLPAGASADAEFRARFEHDADLAATLWHPHIVGVHGRGTFRGRLWIATDFVDGSDAARLMRERYPDGMPAEEVIAVVTAVADALDYAHGRQLSHHAVSPANIVLTAATSRRILLADFGIPRVDGTDDQRALAVTAHHLLSGAPSFAPVPGRPDLVAIAPVIARATAQDPSARFATCLDFAHALRDCLADEAATAMSPVLRKAGPTLPVDGPETGPKQPVFVPAWSEEPAPDPYLDPYADDPATSDAMTMTAIPVSAPPPRTGTSRQTWAVAGMAGVAAVIALAVVLMVLGRDRSDDAAQASTGPPLTSGAQPPPGTSAPGPTAPGQTTPSQIPGPDGTGETCADGYQITGRDGWATHARRGNPAATCTFTGNVLRAYWQAADPSAEPRTIVAAGAIPCSDGAQCAGNDFVVTCGVEGSDPWVTCRGGRDAIVYLY